LYERIAAESKFSIHRLRITLPKGASIPNDKSVTVASTELQDGDTIQVKDLGPQIAWRTVFIIEYLGPLLIHPLIYYLRPYIYTLPPLDAGPSTLQTLSLAMIVLHFLKRELETLFVHRFSLATMPFLNVFKNSAHYWLF
jgi:very-long-chain enoyl-CoA reductase